MLNFDFFDNLFRIIRKNNIFDHLCTQWVSLTLLSYIRSHALIMRGRRSRLYCAFFHYLKAFIPSLAVRFLVRNIFFGIFHDPANQITHLIDYYLKNKTKIATRTSQNLKIPLNKPKILLIWLLMKRINLKFSTSVQPKKNY